MYDTVTFSKAAEKLGVSLRTIQRMVRDGWIRPVYQDGHDLIRTDELAAVQELRYQNLTLAEVSVMAKLSAAKVLTLERQLDRLTEFFGIDVPVLSTEYDDVLAQYAEVESLLREEMLPLSDVRFVIQWSRRFYAMGEEQFQLISDYTADPEPWSKILKLATKMFSEKPRHQDPELEQAYRHLLVGRRFMRQAAYFYVRRQHGYDKASRLFKEVKGGTSYAILSTAFPPEA